MLNRYTDPEQLKSFEIELSKNTLIVEDDLTGYNLTENHQQKKKYSELDQYQKLETKLNTLIDPSLIKNFSFANDNSVFEKRDFAYQLGAKQSSTFLFLRKLHNKTYESVSMGVEPVWAKYYTSLQLLTVVRGNHRLLAQYLYGENIYMDQLIIFE